MTHCQSFQQLNFGHLDWLEQKVFHFLNDNKPERLENLKVHRVSKNNGHSKESRLSMLILSGPVAMDLGPDLYNLPKFWFLLHNLSVKNPTN